LRPSYRFGPPIPSFAKPADYQEETGSDEIKKPPHNAILGGGHTGNIIIRIAIVK
jgi:hypothetical protein